MPLHARGQANLLATSAIASRADWVETLLPRHAYGGVTAHSALAAPPPPHRRKSEDIWRPSCSRTEQPRPRSSPRASGLWCIVRERMCVRAPKRWSGCEVAARPQIRLALVSVVPRLGFNPRPTKLQRVVEVGDGEGGRCQRRCLSCGSSGELL